MCYNLYDSLKQIELIWEKSYKNMQARFQRKTFQFDIGLLAKVEN